MSTALYNIKQNRFFASVLICETVATDLGFDIPQLAFIRHSIYEYSEVQSDKFGQWVDSFERNILSLASREELLPALLVKIHTYAMDMNNYGKALGNKIPFPFMEEIRVLKGMGEQMGYDKNVYKRIMI